MSILDIDLENAPAVIQRVVTGWHSFDNAFANQEGEIGLPLTIWELTGPGGGGKTTLSLSLAGMVAQGGYIVIASIEDIDPNHVKTCLNASGYSGKVKFILEETDETMFDTLMDHIRNPECKASIMDSIGSISPIGELEGSHGEANMGRRAKLVSENLRRVMHVVRETPKLCLYINHQSISMGTSVQYMTTKGGSTPTYLNL